MIKHLKSIIDKWQTDGDHDAKVIRIADTGVPTSGYALSNELGRIPVGVQIIKKDKPCDVYIVQADEHTIVLQFTGAHCDVNLRVW